MNSIKINPLCVICGDEIEWFRVSAITHDLLSGKCKWRKKQNDESRNKQMIQEELLKQLRQINKRLEEELDSLSENFDAHIEAEDLTLDIEPIAECEYQKSASASVMSLHKNSIVIFEFDSVLSEKEKEIIEAKLENTFANNPTVKILILDPTYKVKFTVLESK